MGLAVLVSPITFAIDRDETATLIGRLAEIG
ncbi:hypothetical protein BH24ACT7_BH24ACT7_00390 [soil metagenome]